MKNLTESRRIICLAQTEHWRHIFRDLECIAKILPLKSAEDIPAQLSRHPESVVLLELSNANVVECCTIAHQYCNNPHDVTFVAVGDESMARWSRLVRQSGIVAQFWSVFQTKRLERMLKLHFGQRPLRQDSLENQIQANLPWKSVPQ